MLGSGRTALHGCMTIRENRKSIMINRALIVIMLIALVVNGFVVSHSISDCEQKLYKELTGKDSPVGGV